MVKFLEIVKAIAALIPAIVEIVKQVEAILPAKGQGAAKLSMVQSILQSAYDKTENAVVKFEDIWPTVSVFVTGLVAAYNASGIFKK